MKIKGSKPRPRVAVVGFPLNDEDRTRLEKLFTSIEFYITPDHIKREKSHLEIDLLILGEKVENYSELLRGVCTISFSSLIKYLPSPEKDRLMGLSDPLKTEEFVENDLPLSFSRIREREEWTSARGWQTIFVTKNPVRGNDNIWFRAWELIKSSAVLSDMHTKAPLATIFIDSERKFGVAWFPLPVKNKIDWIEAIVNDWSISFPERFPSIGNWARRKEWLLNEEIQTYNDIKVLEEKREAMIKKIDGDIKILTDRFKELTSENDMGYRKLLTAQGDDLVSIVKKVFEKLGFNVENVDEKIKAGKAKKEDLRLTIKDVESWEAIAEIRGYEKSSGKEGDINRLNKFSRFYSKEKGKFPSKIIYVVNGPIELQPPQRQKPFQSNPEFLDSFADDDVLVISTITLYRVLQNIESINIDDIAKSIIESKGEWNFDLNN